MSDRIDGPAFARPPAKIERVLAALLERPRTTRELEAAPVFDHVGHSTAADLRRMGLRLISRTVKIPGYQGMPALIAEYSIAAESRAAAEDLLGRMRERRRCGRS